MSDTSTGDQGMRGRVLICDDSRVIRAVVKLHLQDLYECIEVESGEAALAAVETFRPDVIISDLQMQGMNGDELCTRIRENAATCSIHFVLMTATQGDDDRARSLELGADDFLRKPINTRELRARVSSLVKLRRTTDALELRTRQLEASHQELSRTHAALAHSERLATLGTLAAGVAHEINNPLAFMKSGIVTLGEMLMDVERAVAAAPQVRSSCAESFVEMKEIRDELAHGITRIQRIVSGLKDFNSLQEVPFEEINVAEEVERAWRLAALKDKERIRFSMECAEPVVMKTDGHKLGQVLLNILLNGAQAMKHTGGALSVAVRAGPAAVTIRIADTGTGIAPEHLPRIFDPFFTTKGPGEGTGLGLSVSYGIIKALGGRLEVTSQLHHGTAFTVHLPLSKEPRKAGGQLPANDDRAEAGQRRLRARQPQARRRGEEGGPSGAEAGPLAALWQ